MSFEPGNRLIAAIDVADRHAALALLDRIGGAADWIKVGLELFIAEGPAFVRELVERGHRVMLDLKLHDIPETVRRSAACAAALGVELLTVHACGGPAMLRAAVEGAREGGSTRVLAVTVLTALDESDLVAVGYGSTSVELVPRLASLAVDAGCHGLVASPLEVASLRTMVPAETLIITPGVRPMGADPGDQKRTATPLAARQAGADLVVVGRPIRDAVDPATAARAIVAELQSAIEREGASS